MLLGAAVMGALHLKSMCGLWSGAEHMASVNLGGAERVLASVFGLALFALNEARMFQFLPRAPDPGRGQTHTVWLRILEAKEPVYLSSLDLALRWSLAALVVGLCAWAVSETFSRRPLPQQD